jgi:hypothetical protein
MERLKYLCRWASNLGAEDANEWYDSMERISTRIYKTAELHTVEIYNQLGMVNAEAGNFDEAIKTFRDTLKIDPRDHLAMEQLGNLLVRTAFQASSVPAVEWSGGVGGSSSSSSSAHTHAHAHPLTDPRARICVQSWPPFSLVSLPPTVSAAGRAVPRRVCVCVRVCPCVCVCARARVLSLRATPIAACVRATKI